MEAASQLRSQLWDAVKANVPGCYAQVPDCQSSNHSEVWSRSPIVCCARHKAQSIHAEMEALEINTTAAIVELGSARDRAVAQGYPSEIVDAWLDEIASEVGTARASKNEALEQAALSADAVLEGALAAVQALMQVRGHARGPNAFKALSHIRIVQGADSLSDDELAEAAPGLLEQGRAARAAVLALPVLPETRATLYLLPPQPPSTAARAPAAATKETVFGRVSLAPPFSTPHAHSPHCSPGCAVAFDTRSCSHAWAPAGAVYRAAKAGDVEALETALSAGGSTEEVDQVRQALQALAQVHVEEICSHMWRKSALATETTYVG